ncbi:hypothetical protein HDE_13662 [Halotydeus destructor]|nr:hypothetical protein HDE_13662 [Halotydeus destructor]
MNGYCALLLVVLSGSSINGHHQGPKTPEQEAKRAIMKTYADGWDKLCAGTFDKMKGLADECSKELDMMNEAVEKCVTAIPQPKKDRKNKKAGNETVTEAPAVSPTPEVIKISDGDTSEPAGNGSSKTLRDIAKYESKVVGCFVNHLKSTGDYKAMKKDEWREAKAKLAMEKSQAKADCLAKKIV